jgi:hypothetical protein
MNKQLYTKEKREAPTKATSLKFFATKQKTI